ncbi:MAG: lysoplasmalogenase family protein [Acidobacteriota bacterium]
MTGEGEYLCLQVQESWLVLVGSLLLLISESVWAINKFKKKFRAAEVVILGTYFPAQLLFALSIG